jgi:hypothetical protein
MTAIAFALIAYNILSEKPHIPRFTSAIWFKTDFFHSEHPNGSSETISERTAGSIFDHKSLLSNEGANRSPAKFSPRLKSKGSS